MCAWEEEVQEACLYRLTLDIGTERFSRDVKSMMIIEHCYLAGLSFNSSHGLALVQEPQSLLCLGSFRQVQHYS